VRPWLAAAPPAVEAAAGALVVVAVFGAVIAASDNRARTFVRLAPRSRVPRDEERERIG